MRLKIYFTSDWIIASLILGLLSGCQAHDDKKSQVVARVNHEEITVYQQYAEVNQPSIKLDARVSPDQATEGLIKDVLFKQALMKEHLDRHVDNVPVLKNAITKAYASVYEQSLLKALASPSNEDVIEFIRVHPDYFYQRTLFEQIEATITSAVSEQDVEFLAYKAKTWDECLDWLTQHEISFFLSTHYVTTDQLDAMFAKDALANSTPNIHLINEGGVNRLKMIKTLMPAPLNERDAFALAKKLLREQQIKDKLETEYRQLRASADIVFTQEKH